MGQDNVPTGLVRSRENVHKEGKTSSSVYFELACERLHEILPYFQAFVNTLIV